MGARRRTKSKETERSAAQPARLPALLPYLLIGLAAFATYLGTLKASFVWDDLNLVVTSPLMSSLTSLPTFFTSDLFLEGNARGDYYRPLFLTSLLLDAVVFGKHAWGFHLTNIILHVLVSVMLYRFTLRTTACLRNGVEESRDVVIALVGALIFAVHPMHAEPVAWISGRNELLYTFFALLAADYFIRNLRNNNRSALLYSVLLYFAALLSKETAAALPAVLFLLVWLTPRENRRRFFRPLAHVAATGAYFLIRALVLDSSGTPGETPFLERLLTAPWLFLTYIFLFIQPFSYKLLHDINYVQSFADPRFWVSLLVLLAGAAGIGFFLRRPRANAEGRLLLFSAGLFTIMTAPVLGILVEIQPVPLAERYAYFPSVGLVLPVALGFAAVMSFARNKDFAKAVPIPMAALLLVLAVFTWHRNTFWADENIFYQRMIRDAPNFYQGYYNRGRRLYAQRNYQGALANFRRAAQLEKRNASIHLNLGVTYYALGDLLAAENALLKAVELRPDFYRPYYNLGILYTRTGRTEDARRNLEQVLKLNPGHRGARNRLQRTDQP